MSYLEKELPEGSAGATNAGPSCRGRLIQAARNAIVAATDNQAPGIARLPVA